MQLSFDQRRFLIVTREDALQQSVPAKQLQELDSKERANKCAWFGERVFSSHTPSRSRNSTPSVGNLHRHLSRQLNRPGALTWVSEGGIDEFSLNMQKKFKTGQSDPHYVE